MRKSSQYLYQKSVTRDPDEVDQFPLRHGDSPDRDEGMNKGRCAAYTRLKFDRPAPRVLRITFASPLKLGAMDARMHQEIADVWKDVAHDDSTKALLLTGEGQTFSAGGDKNHELRVLEDHGARMQSMREARDLVYNMIDCPKRIVSAARGWAVTRQRSPHGSVSSWNPRTKPALCSI